MAEEGVSSMSFWLFFWMEHSPLAQADHVPLLVGEQLHLDVLDRGEELLHIHPPVPEAFSASAAAVWKAFSSSSSPFTRRMPLPPPRRWP